jgi:hypothetical protein
MGLSHWLENAKSSILSTQGSKLLQVTEGETDANDGGNIVHECPHTPPQVLPALSGAPCHPDWLDTSGKLREHNTPSVALDSADRALLSLTRFGIKFGNRTMMRWCKS